MNFLKFFFRLGIRWHLAFLSLAILMPVLVWQGFEVDAKYQALYAREVEANLEMARAARRLFLGYIDRVLDAQTAISFAIVQKQHSPEEISTILTEFVSRTGFLLYLGWVSPECRVLGSSLPGAIGMDLSDRPNLVQVAKGADWSIGDLVMGRASRLPVFQICKAVRDHAGNLNGMIVAGVNEDNLERAMAVERRGSAAISLYDRNGMLAFRSPKLNPTWEQRNWLRDYPFIREVLEGREYTGTVVAPYDGQERIVANVPIELGWGAGAGRQKQEVTAAIFAQMRDSLVGLAAILAMAAAAVAYLSEQIARSAGTLREKVEAIGRGEQPTPEEGMITAEFQSLSQGIDRMAWTIAHREAALRESREFLHLLSNNLPESAVYQYVHEPDGQARFIYFSAGIERLNGVRPQDVLSDPGTLHRQIPKEYFKQLEEAEARSKRELSDFDMDVPMRLPDGQIRWMRLRSRPRRLPNGRTIWDGVQTDITHRKLAVDAIRESEERYRTLFDSMTEGFALHQILLDKQGRPVDYRFLNVNPAFERMTGLKKADVLGKCVREVLPGIEGHWIDTYGRVALTGEPVHFENYSASLEKWFEVYAYRPATGQFAVMFTDITARRQAELAVLSTQRQTQSIIDNTPDIVYAFDLEHRFLMANTAVAALFNTTPNQLIGKRRHEIMPKEDAERHEAHDNQVLEADRMLEFEEYSQLEDRSITWLTKKFPLRDAQGRVYGTAGISADISERKRNEEQLQQLTEMLETRVMERTADLHAANQALTERATQLRALAGELAMVEQRERKALAKLLHDGLQQYLVAARMRQGSLIQELGDHPARESAKEIEGLLAESLTVSRTLAAELSPPALEAGICAGLEWLSRFMASKHGLNVRLVIETKGLVLPEDVKVFLFESARELLLNVVKHSKVRTADVHLKEEQHRLKVTFSDLGVGFDLPTIAGLRGETGFGLFSMRERGSLMGIEIDMESSLGKGSSITLIVPIERSVSAGADYALSHDKRARPAPDGSGRIRILLADDHKVMRESLAQMLGAEGDFEIAGQAEDGNVAVELADALQPDVVLMDISMPNMDGITATRIIAQRYPRIHVIGLSFHTADERAHEMMEAGASLYLSKTAPPDALKRAIRSCLGGRCASEQSNRVLIGHPVGKTA